jgi:hypothetical protein
MSLNAQRTRLTTITKELLNRWQETRQDWKDQRSQEFGHQYMEQLMLQSEKAIAVCEKLDKILTKIRTDCE